VIAGDAVDLITYSRRVVDLLVLGGVPV